MTMIDIEMVLARPAEIQAQIIANAYNALYEDGVAADYSYMRYAQMGVYEYFFDGGYE